MNELSPVAHASSARKKTPQRLYADPLRDLDGIGRVDRRRHARVIEH